MCAYNHEDQGIQMTTVFVGGSRKIGRLNEAVRRRLDNIVEKRIPVLVGDANGADKAVQAYLYEKSYDNVSVFYTGDVCRNNLGGWPTTPIEPPEKSRRKDRRFYALKDAAMSRQATHGFMLWDGRSVGTLVNVIRLMRDGKAAVIYLAPSRSFLEVRGVDDYEKLVKHCTSDLVSMAEREVDSEDAIKESAAVQRSLGL